MGRQQYLERLALGRSPFQDPVASPEDEEGSDGTQLMETAAEIRNGQYYDSKGRPTNKRTEERNAAMRNAQNAVLALVGVVESKDASDEAKRMSTQITRMDWEKLLEAEQERGENLNMVLEYVHRLLRWWPEAVMARIQAGLYLPSQSFGDILLGNIRTARMMGLSACFVVFLPGIIPHALSMLADTLLCTAVVEGLGSVEAYLGSLTKSRRLSRWIHVSANLTREVLCAGVSIALMPLEYHAETQRLGLAPNSPMVPHWRYFMPTGPLSYHRFLWTSPLGSSRLPLFGSPGFWLVLQRALTRYQDEGPPIAATLTDWEYPPVNQILAYRRRAELYQDPLSWIFYHTYMLRYRTLKWLGWSLQAEDPFPDSHHQYQNNTAAQAVSYVSGEHAADDDSERCKKWFGRYRSTALSMQLAKFLGERIDYVLQKLLLFSLESTAVRAITQSFLTSTLPRTSLALAVAPFAYSPLGGGPLSSLFRPGSNPTTWNVAGSYLSKIGLSFALYCSTEVAISFLIYRVYRSQGIHNFGWTSKRDWED
jgi:hypothetical protein